MLVNIFDKEKREAEVKKIVGIAARADHIATRTDKAINVKMNDDSIYYKKLSTLIRQTIEDYHQHRISEAEYLQRAKGYENQFLSGKQNNIPAIIQEKPTVIAYYNQINTILEDSFIKSPNPKDTVALLATEIEEGIKSVVYEYGTLIIDWQKNAEIEKAVKNSLDDLLYEKQRQYDVEFSFQSIDSLIEEIIKIAKLKYI